MSNYPSNFGRCSCCNAFYKLGSGRIAEVTIIKMQGADRIERDVDYAVCGFCAVEIEWRGMTVMSPKGRIALDLMS